MTEYSSYLVDDDRTMRLLEQHLDLVIEANKTTNITRITSRDEARVLHIEDSLSGLPEFEHAPDGLYADMGSGAGFPGIPLSIVTHRNTVLIESVGKKATLLEMFAQGLGLSDSVSVYSGRVEDLAREHAGEFAVITARALSQLPSLLELAAPLLQIGGQLICYKAHIEQDEFDHACSLQEKLGLACVSDRSFTLSDDETFRRIVVFEKISEPTISLPRRNGMAQKRPY